MNSATNPQPPVSGRTMAVARAVAVLVTLGIGLASFVLSFTALADLAHRAGIPAHLAWLWPLIVDGTILQATMAIIALSGRAAGDGTRRYFWVVLSASAAVSVIGNAWHAVLPTAAPLNPWLAAAIAVVAPVSLLAATHGLSLLIRVSSPTPQAAQTPAFDAIRLQLSDFDEPVRDETPAEPVDDASVPEVALEPWAGVADVIASRAPERGLDADAVATVLHLTHERDMRPAAIARRLGIGERHVRDVVADSTELLQSGDVSVERAGV